MLTKTNFVCFHYLSVFVLCSCFFFLSCQETEKESPKIEQKEVSSTYETSPDSIQAEGLLSINEVYDLLQKDTTIVVFEVSKKAEYAKGHLANAQSIWRPDYESKSDYAYNGMCASRSEIAILLGKKGIQASDKIILYDAKGSCDAIRFAWILKMYGHQEIYIMNGGKVAWQKANFPLTKELPVSFAPVNYQFELPIDTSSIAHLDDLKKAINKPNTIILDTRNQEEYLGKAFLHKGEKIPWKTGAYSAGCIPSAIHLNWSDAVDLAGDHRFKCLKDLKYNFKQAGLSPDKTILVYCQSGVRSAHTAYVLREILHYPNVKNYDGSWIEWSYFHTQNASVPIEQH